MDSEDDVQPLISYDETSRELFLELTVQILNADSDYDQVKLRTFSSFTSSLIYSIITSSVKKTI